MSILNETQHDVLLGVILGKEYAVIGKELSRSKSYVGNVVTQICDKLGAVDIHHAIAIAYEEGLLTRGDRVRIRAMRVRRLSSQGKSPVQIVQATGYDLRTVIQYLASTGIA